jgi:hypothetical protein
MRQIKRHQHVADVSACKILRIREDQGVCRKVGFGPTVFTFDHGVEVGGELLDVDPPIPALLYCTNLALASQAAHVFDIIARILGGFLGGHPQVQVL